MAKSSKNKSGKKKHWLRRKWGVLLTLGLVCCLVAGGVWVAFFRGSARAGLFEKGITAYRAGKLAEAEEHFRSVLKTQPNNGKARMALLSMLMDAKRYDDAEPLAREWTKIAPQQVEAWSMLVEIAVRRFQLDKAERMARAIADLAPQFAQLTILRVRDVRGSFLDRLQSVEAAISLASLGAPPVLKAELHLYAVETLLDLAGNAPEASKGPMQARAERYRAIAEKSLKASDLTGKALRHAVARTRLLSKTESEQSLGARTLTDALQAGSEELDSDASMKIREALARYHSARKEWDEAGAVIRELRDGSFLAWFRAVRRVAEQGPVELALALLEGDESGEQTPITLLRAQALLRGTEEQREAGSKLLTDLVEQETSNPALGIRAYNLLAAGGSAGAGLELLESVAGSGSDVRAEALLARELSANEASRDRALRMIETLPGKVSSLAETLDVLRLLRQGGGEGFDRYLKAEILVGGAEGARKRLLRAAACVALGGSTRDEAQRARLQEAVVADLAALEQPKLTKADLARAWVLARAVGETRLAGSLVARAIGMEGPPYGLSFACVQLAGLEQDDARRAPFSEGILAHASAEGPSAFLQVLGAAVNRHPVDKVALMQDVEKASADGSSAVPALFLRVQLAFEADDRAKAEETARKLVQVMPDSPEARVLLGDLLVMRKDWDGLLKLHPEATGSLLGIYRQRVAALWELDRKEEALEAARLAVRNFPRSPDAHLLLAHLHLRAERRNEALGVLSVAPLTRPVALLRARLLMAKGEKLVPEMLYIAVLARRPNDIEALRGMTSIFTSEGRSDELLGGLTQRLDSPQLAKDAPDRAEMLVMRATAHERLKQDREALVDYDEALRILPKNLMALNNAAWLILDRNPDQIAQAEDYLKRALSIAPEHPSVLDTAARLYQLKGEFTQALKFADDALRAQEKPSYMMRRAELLESLERPDDARAQLEKLREKFPDSKEARKAKELLKKRAGGK